MKKERITLFPEIESFMVAPKDKDQIQLMNLSPGNIYRIGQPSAEYYQHIDSAIVPKNLNVRESDDFNTIEGSIIKVTSIISMVSGKRVAVLRHYEDKLFLGKFEKIFAQVDMSITSREIISLDLESKRNLESIKNNKSKS